MHACMAHAGKGMTEKDSVLTRFIDIRVNVADVTEFVSKPAQHASEGLVFGIHEGKIVQLWCYNCSQDPSQVRNVTE